MRRHFDEENPKFTMTIHQSSWPGDITSGQTGSKVSGYVYKGIGMPHELCRIWRRCARFFFFFAVSENLEGRLHYSPPPAGRGLSPLCHVAIERYTLNSNRNDSKLFSEDIEMIQNCFQRISRDWLYIWDSVCVPCLL